ncbi:hypothetical protein H7B90_07580 [Cohnella xylanilytica]|uniref:Uncharacterized protein n=1 Tax=Cohnella xylanilytica TaxID=557555 RepID=A0A841TW69_9BACL|nr:hypothetical protein [Cohnella xylanilytica]MBB6691252.1 hypothetical protein [Cohnella xylanilytica]
MTREDGPGWKPSHPLGIEVRLGAVPPSVRTGAAPPADGLASERRGAMGRGRRSRFDG